MPGLDGRGPVGGGPMTGGGRGYCNSSNTGYGTIPNRGFNYGRGLGFRRGFGSGPFGGRGSNRNYGNNGPVYAQPYPLDETSDLDILKADANNLTSALDEINKRIEALEKAL